MADGPEHDKRGGAAGLSRGYAAAVGADDEMWAPGAGVRPHWRAFIDAADSQGADQLGRQHRQIMRLLRENGVTYNVHGDPDGWHRPWELDPIPMIIASDEWDRLEVGLAQRALLVDLIFADLYGARTLLKEGLLPPELVFAHPGFLRSCDGIRHRGDRQITLMAVDLARGPDRQFTVAGDRVQAPSGAGYALENRTVMARVFPDLIRNCRVRRLAQFFRILRSVLTEIAPRPGPTPGIGVLTPGPANETYFEQAYLAAYLGFTLVQGDDLMVRDGAVWLKSLDGLKPLDVLLRRVDDIFCDPLELRSDSRLGVAGLLEAILVTGKTIAHRFVCSVSLDKGDTRVPERCKVARHLSTDFTIIRGDFVFLAATGSCRQAHIGSVRCLYCVNDRGHVRQRCGNHDAGRPYLPDLFLQFGTGFAVSKIAGVDE
jgi:uncharacterized circularly permuted ATP-grasp superfamily protein